MKLFEDINLKNTINIIILAMIISAIFGFMYEELFYLISLGKLVKRGSTYGPWIPIYAFGALLIILFSYKFRNKPVLVFFINCFSTGILEYTTGLVLDKVFHTKLWNYKTEALGFLNFNGYICFRSIVLFGISSLFIIYLIVPKLINLSKKISERKLTIFSYTLGGLFISDMFVHLIVKILK